jgi:hypothetical protein
MPDPLISQQGTVLVLTGMGITLYSARGCTQTFEMIPAAKVQRRSINGKLHDLSYSQFWKYQTEITCHDQREPALDGIHYGTVLTVNWVAELAVATGTAASRPVVTGSDYTEGGFYRYRPQLNMMVTGYSSGNEEWAAGVNWKLSLEEV